MLCVWPARLPIIDRTLLLQRLRIRTPPPSPHCMQDAYKAREAFAPFTTPTTMTVAGGLVEGQLASVQSKQQEAEQRAAALKKEAESRCGS